VADRSLVLDANILVRAVLGVRVRGLLERYGRDVEFAAPDAAFKEVEDHLPLILAGRGLSPDLAMATFERVSMIVQELPLPYYAGQESAARARIAMRDSDDWPVLACALTRRCPVWTEDQDFFGVGVPTWTTDRIEMFLAASI
jgi:predicted nucleic acid-binding protein